MPETFVNREEAKMFKTISEALINEALSKIQFTRKKWSENKKQEKKRKVGGKEKKNSKKGN